MPRTIRQRTIAERLVAQGRELELDLTYGDTRTLHAVLQLPQVASAAPAVLMLHGFSSRKEVLAESVGRRLVHLGIVSLAIDLPLHGARRGTPDFQAALRNPLEVMAHWRQALREARLGIRYLQARPEVDRARIGVVGYSLGAQIGAAVTAEEAAVKALVIAAGGDLPVGSPVTLLARRVADPISAIRKLNGRPLLMLHGRTDRTVTPDQAGRLFEAAPEPKEFRWYDAGHRLPPAAIDDAGRWLASTL